MDKIVVSQEMYVSCVCGNDCNMTVHHRRPKSIGGSDEEPNLIRLPTCLHQAWHQVFGNSNAGQIASYISRRRLLVEEIVSTPRWWDMLDDSISQADALSTYVLHPRNERLPHMTTEAKNVWHNILFSHLGTSAKIIQEINQYYLDPCYRLALVR